MEGRLLFAPDPFIKQKWYGFKAGNCILKGSFLNILEKNNFLSSKSVEYSIPLELCSVRSITHPKKHLFEVVTSSGSKFNFIAGSQPDAQRWITKIKERSSIVMMPSSSNTSIQSAHRYQPPTSSGHSCSSFLGRKKFNSSSKGSKESQRSQRKGRTEGLKRYGSMVLGGTFAHNGTFGVALEQCKLSSKVEHVPDIVVKCTEIIEERGLDHQGLYRVPGNTTQVNSLYHELMVWRDDMITTNDERWKDVNVVGSLFKLFFRKLPSPLITTELYKPSIEAIRKPSEKERLVTLKEVLERMPAHHFATFRHLAVHLNKIASWETANKMNSHNLSIVFGPTLICSREENETSRMVVDMPDQCLVVELIIKNVEWLFGCAKNNTDIDKASRANDCRSEAPFINQDDLFATPLKSDFDAILESKCEKESEQTPHLLSNQYLSIDYSNINDASNCHGDVPSINNSCTGSTPLSSRGQSPFPDVQSNQSTAHGHSNLLDCDWVSEGGRESKDFTRTKMRSSLRSRAGDGDMAEKALQHLKRLNLDLRTFKHRLDIERMEQLQRNVSRERIEREYERTLVEFECAQKAKMAEAV